MRGYRCVRKEQKEPKRHGAAAHDERRMICTSSAVFSLPASKLIARQPASSSRKDRQESLHTHRSESRCRRREHDDDDVHLFDEIPISGRTVCRTLNELRAAEEISLSLPSATPSLISHRLRRRAMSRRKQSCPQHLTSKHDEDGPFALLQQEEKNEVGGRLPIPTGAASLSPVTRTPADEDDDALDESGPLQEGDARTPENNPSPVASSMSVTGGSGQIRTEKEEIDAHICGQCRAEFMGLTAFLMHKKNCCKRPIVRFPGAGDEHPSIAQPEDAIRQTADHNRDKDPLPETTGTREPLLRSRSPFSALPIPLSGAPSPASSSTGSRSDDEDERLTPSPSKLPKQAVTGNEWPATSDLGASVVLTRRLQNTNVAVAQQLAPSHAESEAGMPPKTLQATLTSLQQHQLMLMSVIHQMQAQLATSGQEPQHNLPFPLPFLLPANVPVGPVAAGPLNSEVQALNQSAPAARSASLSPASRSPPHRHRQSLHHRSLRGVSSSPPRGDAASKALSASGSAAVRQGSHKSGGASLVPVPESGPRDLAAAVTAESGNFILPPTTDNNASSTNNNKDSLKPEKVQEEAGSPPAAESSLNTLELLQLHTEKALQNTMSGSSFLVNGISGLGGPDFLKFRKDGKEDPSYRHRCRYCGKVFGSDSALQIHIRSHTGERPFKCNICGNRFSTKGNLKVHFQRHKTKYPHVKMNPNPVPEHLDKFHPPLEPPSGSQSPSRSDSSPPPHASSSTAPASYAGLFGPTSSTASAFEGMRNAFQCGRDFPSARSRLGSFFAQLDAAKSGSAPKDQSRNRSPPMQNLQDLPGLSAVSFSHSNDASNMSMTEESDRESEGKQEGDRISARKRPSDPADPPADAAKEDEAGSGGERSGPRDAKREKRSSDSYFLKDRQIKQEKSAGDDEDDEDVLSGDDAVPNGRNGQSHRSQSKDRDSDLEDSSNAGSSTGNRDEDESDGQSNQSGATGAAFPGLLNASSFHNYFPPGMFPGSLAGMLPPGFSLPPGLHVDRASVIDPNAPPGTLAGDPHLYQDLLPKPGSNDNAWESLMEIQKASETTKLQHLVDNIENKMTDPNQCIICHRVLSCKSALQMHYRTHTGERPFKCKLCSRAFTTKGNLKTHMGVHRVKPPLRILHQCPVCHKQFTNALVLQQHIRMHTGEPTDIPPEHIMANEIKHSSQLVLPSFHRQPIGLSPFGHLPPVSQAAVNPFFAQLMNSQFGQHLHQQQLLRRQNSGSIDLSGRKDGREESPKNQKPDSDGREPNPDRSSVSTVTSDKESHSATPLPPQSPPQQLSPPNNNHMQVAIAADDVRNPFSVSLTALEKHVKTITTVDPNTMPATLLDASKLQAIRDTLSRSKTGAAVSQGDGSLMRGAARSSSRNQTMSPASCNSRDASIDGSASMNALDDQRSSPGSGRMGDENSRTLDSVPGNGTALDLTPRGSSGGHSPMSVGSARGLPSPGIIRPPHMFPPLFAGLPFPTGKSSTTCQICMKTFACNSALEIHYRSHTKERPFKCDVCDRGFSTKGNMKQHMLTHKIRDLPANLYTTTTTTMATAAPAASGRQAPPARAPSIADSNSQTSMTMALAEVENGGSKSEPNGLTSPESRGGGSDRRSGGGSSHSSPAARRSSSHVSKHVCSVCSKPFSSHSALQIHMRTHTGDKPFKCTICGRAFTTKGNLKVHMGTHMWNNGSSRRGRRMSIDLPNMHVTPPKGADGFPQSFFPALPIAYMNGMNGQNNRAADIDSVYAAQFQAKLQACQNSSLPKGCLTSAGDAMPEEGTRSDDDDQASRVSDDEDSQSPAASSSRRNGQEGSVDEDGSDDRSTPRSWTKSEECKKLSPSSKALTAS